MVDVKEFRTDSFPKDNIFLLSLNYKAGNPCIELLNKNNNEKIQFLFDGFCSISLMENNKAPNHCQRMTIGYHRLKESKYLEWYHQQSYNIRKYDEIEHFLIVTVNSTISILSAIEPTIKIY